MFKKIQIFLLVAFLTTFSFLGYGQCPPVNVKSVSGINVSCNAGKDGKFIFDFYPITVSGTHRFILFTQSGIPYSGSITASAGPITFSGINPTFIPSGSYEIRYFGGSGCSNVIIPNTKLTIKDPISPYIITGFPIDEICQNDNNILFGSDPVPDNDTIRYKYFSQWYIQGPNSNLISYVPDNKDQLALVGGFEVGTYTAYWSVSVAGCGPALTSSGASFTVNEYPSISSTLTATVCSSLPFNYTITSTTSGTTFNWSRAAVSGISNAASSASLSVINETLVNTTSNPVDVFYQLNSTGPGATACTGIPSVLTVTVNPTPQANSTPASDTKCSGQPVNFLLTSNLSNTTFSWTVSVTSGVVNGITSGTGSNITQTPVVNGSQGTFVYQVVPFNTLTGCSALTSFDIPVTINPIPTVSGADVTVCGLSAVSVSLTTNAVSFNWSSGQTINPASLTPVSLGLNTFTATVTSGAGCSATTTVGVFAQTPVTVTSVNTTVCGLSPVTIGINTNGTSINWFDGSNTSSILVTPSVSGLNNYLVTVSSGICSVITTVSVLALPTVTVNGINSTVCGLTAVSNTLNTNGINFLWNNGQTTNPATLIPTVPGLNTFSVTVSSGICSVVTSVGVLAQPLVTVIGTNSTICGVSSVLITLTTNGTSFNWNTGQSTNPVIVIPVVGFNSYTATVSSGVCSVVTTVSVLVQPLVTVSSTNTTVCGLTPTVVTLNTNGTNFLWDNGLITNPATLIPTVTGLNTFTATITSGVCSVTTTAGITVIAIPTVSGNNATVCGLTAVTISVNTNAPSINWFDGTSAASVLVTPGSFGINNYNATVSSSICNVVTTVSVLVQPVVTVSSINATVCGLTPATIGVIANGTSINWFNGSTTSSISVTPAVIGINNYNVTVISGVCSVTTIVSVLAQPLVTVNSVNITVCGLTATAGLLTTNGTNFIWSNGQATNPATLTPTALGLNTFTATISSGICSATTTVGVFAQPTVTVTSNVTTFCGLPGTMSVTVTTNGTNFNWFDGSTGSAASVTPVAGLNTYAVTVSSGLCSVVTSTGVFVIPTITVSGFVKSICGISATTITATTNGSGINWFNGNTTATIGVTPTTTGLSLYPLTITSGNICSLITTVGLFVEPTVIVTSNVTTFCGLPGTMSVTVTTNGTNFNWFDGSTGSAASVTPVAGLNTYAVTVSSGLCSVVTSTGVYILPPLTVNSTITTICGTTAGLSISVSTNAPDILWGNGSSTNPTSVGVSGFGLNTFNVTVSSAACGAGLITTVGVFVDFPITATGLTTSICGPGMAVVSITGDSGDFYQWPVSAGGSSGTGLTVISIPFVGASATYNVTVSSALCSGIVPVSVVILSLPNVLISGPNNACSGSNVTLIGSNAITYFWNDGINPTVTGTSFTTVPVFPSSSYTVTGYDGFGCSSFATKVVTVNSDVIMPSAPSGTTLRCQAAGTDVYSSTSPLSLINATSLGWSLSAGTSSLTILSPSSISVNWDPAYAGTTVLTVTAFGTCGIPSSNTLTITVNSSPGLNAGIVQHESACSVADGMITATGFGATGPYNYTISGLLPYIDANTSGIFTSLSGNNTYAITVEDANTCKTTLNGLAVTVAGVTALPFIDFADNGKNFCLGQTVAGITVTVSGASAIIGLYQNGSLVSTSISPLSFVPPSSAGAYNFIANYTLTGCTGPLSNAVSYNITVSSLPVIGITAQPSSPICSGSPVLINFTTTGNDFSWDRPGISGIAPATNAGITTSINENVTNNNAGATDVNYLISSSITGCTSSLNVTTVTVNVLPAVTPFSVPTLAAICSGSVTNIEFGGSAFTFTGIPAPGSITGVTSSAVPVIAIYDTLTGEGNIDYTITPIANGCAGTSIIASQQLSGPIVIATILGPNSVCNGSSTTYTAVSTNATSFAWSMFPVSAGSINNTTGTFSWDPSYSGGVFIILTAFDNCSNFQQYPYSVTVNQSPLFGAISVTQQSDCNDGSIMASGIGNNLNFTLTGLGYTSINIAGVFTALGTNTYDLILGDTVSGCTVNTVIGILSPTSLTSPIISFAGDGNTYCEGTTIPGITVTTTLVSGIIGLYDENGLLVASSASPLSYPASTLPGAGFHIYSANVTVGGCVSAASLPISYKVDSIPSAPTISGLSLAYCQNQPASPLTALGVNIQWYDVTGALLGISSYVPSTTALGINTYYASQTINGCESAWASVNVTVNGLSTAAFLNANDTICGGDSRLVILTGTPNWTIVLSDGISQFPVSGISSSPYSLAFTTVLGMTSYQIISVTGNGCGTSISGSGLVTVRPNTDPLCTCTCDAIIIPDAYSFGKKCSGDASVFSFNVSVTGIPSYPATLLIDRNGGNTFSYIINSAQPFGIYPVSVTGDTTTIFTLKSIQTGVCSGPVSATTFAELTVTPKPVLTTTGIITPLCNQSADLTAAFTDINSLTSTLLGTQINYYYQNGSTLVAVSNPQTVTTAGIYMIEKTVFGGSTCAGTALVTVSFPSKPAALVLSDSVCSGNTGFVTVLINSGTSPYAFNYTDGTISGSVSLASGFSGFTVPGIASSYTISGLTDNGGCTGTVSGLGNMTLKLPINCVTSCSASGTISAAATTICGGSATMLTFNVSGVAGNKNVVYSDGINPFYTISGILGASTTVGTGVLTTTSTFTLISVSDQVCTQNINSPLTITVNNTTAPSAPVLTLTVKPTQEFDLAWPTVAGENYITEWSTDGFITASTFAGNGFTSTDNLNILPGIYDIRVLASDICGQTAYSNTVTGTIVGLSATITGPTSALTGQTVTLTFILSGQAPFTGIKFTDGISPFETIIPSAGTNVFTIPATVFITTTYSVTSFTDANGKNILRSSVPLTITVVPPVTPVSPIVSITAPISNVICDAGILIYTVTGTGLGIAPTYTWVKNGVTVPGLNSNVITVGGIYSGATITLTGVADIVEVQIATDPNTTLGINAAVIVKQLPLITVSNVLIDSLLFTPVKCTGGSDGSIYVIKENNDTRLLQYSINSGLFQTSPIFSRVKDTLFLVTIRDSLNKSCVQNLTTTGPGTSNFLPVITPYSPSCQGSDGSIRIQVLSSVFSTYNVTLSGLTTIIGTDTTAINRVVENISASYTIDGLSFGSYSITFGYNGCSTIAIPIDLTGATPPTADLGTDTANICLGSSVILTNNGLGTEFIWLANDTILSNLSTSTQVFTPSQDTKYTVRVKGSNDCLAEDFKFVRVASIDIKLVTTLEPEDKQVAVKWHTNNLKYYPDTMVSVQRRIINPFPEAWITVGSVAKNDSSFVNSNDSTSITVFEYRITAASIAECASTPHNTIWLRGSSDEPAATVSLNWNPYKNWKTGVIAYQVWRKMDDESGFTLVNAVSAQDTSITLEGVTEGFNHQYRILAVSAEPTQDSIIAWSNIITLNFNRQVEIYNAFSPNSDGKNETFEIKNIYAYPESEVFIFNRWGVKVYYEKGYQNRWHGTDMPDGTYFYILKLNDKAGTMFKGNVLLQR